MIKSISIKNFKSILEVSELKFGDVTFIVGKNGAGKSTLINALYLTMKLVAKEDLDDVINSTAPFGYEVFNQTSRQTHSHFEMIVKTEKAKSYKFSYSYAYNQSGMSFGILDESLSRIEGAESVLIYERKGDDISVFVSKTNSYDSLPLSVSSTELAIANYSDDEVKSVAEAITNCRVLWFDKATDSNDFKIHSREKLDSKTLDSMAVSLYLNDKKAFDKAVHVVGQLIPEFKAPEIRSIAPSNSDENSEKSKLNTRYVVFWKEKDVDSLQYTLTGLSDGNFRIIQLIFSMFSSRNSTCLIGEEIENGQHFGRLKTLLEVIKVLSIKLNVQLIFTTHSRDLLKTVSPSDVIYSWKDDKGNSQYAYLDEHVDMHGVEEDLGTAPTAKDLLDLGLV